MSVTFPNDSQFIALENNGIPYTDPAGDENPAGVDIVGTLAYPAIYFVTENDYAFFRFRLRGDPRNIALTGFQNFAWVVLIDTQNDLSVYSYSWELALVGNTNAVMLKENLIRNSPGTGFNDQAEGDPILFPITDYDIARAVKADSTLGGEQNYFLDFAMEVSLLKSYLGITDITPLRFTYVTATNENNYNKDLICSDFFACFSDHVTIVTSLSGLIINKEDGSGIAEATVELYDGNTLIASTTTNSTGAYTFTGISAGDYSIKVTKCCFIPNCFCNKVTVQSNKNTIYNIALAYDCICELKCVIGEIEAEMIAEKQRLYKQITDYFISITPSNETLSRYITLLCLLDDSTAELDCSIAKVLEELTLCEGGQ